MLFCNSMISSTCIFPVQLSWVLLLALFLCCKSLLREPLKKCQAFPLMHWAVCWASGDSSDAYLIFLDLEKHCLKIKGYRSSLMWSFNGEKQMCVYIFMCACRVVKLMTDTVLFLCTLRFWVFWKRNNMLFDNLYCGNSRDSSLIACKFNF